MLPFLDVYVLPKGDFTAIGLSLYIIMLSFEKKGSAIVTKNMEIKKVYQLIKLLSQLTSKTETIYLSAEYK